MCFGSPFPLLGPPGPHTCFVFQEGEQVLPRPLLPHHCALQVRREGLWDGGGGMGGDRMARGQRALRWGIPDSCPSVPTPCARLPGTLPAGRLDVCHLQPVGQSQHAMSFQWPMN